ncbi:hypothetical protein [Bosea minatitlanensis]|uniref:Uncharacterized protein n=1 Tax=Bosea minatitlanensis TaxID=128782 RepID=A0ABW0F6Y6_9HYPH|nr:hypothetical protein [Bosea minatitlanensis]MCT4496138.1 hypothetical protein [Bosea minatitlanensis]
MPTVSQRSERDRGAHATCCAERLAITGAAPATVGFRPFLLA